MAAAFEPYRVQMRSWPGATREALVEALRQLQGATTNDCPSFEEIEVSLGERGVLTVTVISEGQGPWDACDFARSIVGEAIAAHCPDVFQDGPSDGEETWCATLVAHHVDADPVSALESGDRAGAPALLTVAEAAARLRVSVDTIRRRAADGSLAAVRIGSVIRIPLVELERVLAQVHVPPAVDPDEGSVNG